MCRMRQRAAIGCDFTLYGYGMRYECERDHLHFVHKVVLHLRHAEHVGWGRAGRTPGAWVRRGCRTSRSALRIERTRHLSNHGALQDGNDPPPGQARPWIEQAFDSEKPG